MLIEKWEAIHRAVEWGNSADLYLKMFLDEHFKYYEPGRRALDLGCGVGGNVGILLNAGFEVYANDCSQTAVEKTIKNYPDDNLHVTVSSFQDLTFYDKFFDLIASVASIEQLNDLDQMIAVVQKCRMWIKPNGRIFLKLLTAPTDERLLRAPIRLVAKEDIEKLMVGFEYETVKVKGMSSDYLEFSHHLVIGRPK